MEDRWKCSRRLSTAFSCRPTPEIPSLRSLFHPGPWAIRARLAVDRVKSVPTVAFAFAAKGAGAHLWRRVGATWIKLTTPAGLNINQAWYDWYVAASPNNQNQVYVGAIDAYRGSVSGSTVSWTDITTRGNNSIHPDQHCLTFAPNNPQVVYAGNDGGIFRSGNSGATLDGAQQRTRHH